MYMYIHVYTYMHYIRMYACIYASFWHLYVLYRHVNGETGRNRNMQRDRLEDRIDDQGMPSEAHSPGAARISHNAFTN